MPERYIEAIVKFLSSADYQPLKPRQLARQMGIAEEDYGSFRQAVKMLRDGGRVVLGAKNALTLPEISTRIVGTFRANPRGFGFVTPETPNSHGDLFIPEDATGGAMNGDTVVAKVLKRGMRAGEMMYQGLIVEIVARGQSRLVGTLQRSEGTWFVLPDGRAFTAPVVIADVGPGAAPGQKVVCEITRYAERGELARGVIVENLGAAGAIAVETRAILRAHGLPEEFPEATLAEARAANERFDPHRLDGREDWTGRVIVTIDPPDARDFDDAISLETRDGLFHLGVHIADVSHFVAPGTALDDEALRRGNSVYFPRKVVPMLPEVLSNGVCSLQEGQRRFCKSAFIRYDAQGRVVGSRLAETVIASRKRLTYTEAQGILEGRTGGYADEVVALLRRMEDLARRIEKRRRAAGMIHLDLPEMELVLDTDGRVTDAVPEDASYTHTIIEMFMVEANEAVARAFDERSLAFLRRIHPAPDAASERQLTSFVRVCGYRLPKDLSRFDVQKLLADVRGKPESYAVNLAVLKSFQSAEYSPMRVGHYALASEQYCHFTSPIRRYPDLTVHRLFADLARRAAPAPGNLSELVKLGEHCSTTERRAEAAEQELRSVLILQLLAQRVGDDFDGVVTGVTNFGIFVQLQPYHLDGLIRLADLGDDWWEVAPHSGEVRGDRSGRRFRIGDPLRVRIVAVNQASRQLNLVPARDGGGARERKAPRPAGASRPGKRRAKAQRPASPERPPRKRRPRRKR